MQARAREDVVDPAARSNSGAVSERGGFWRASSTNGGPSSPIPPSRRSTRPIDRSTAHSRVDRSIHRSVGPSQSVELRSIGLLSIDRSVGPHQAGSPPPWRVGRASQPSPQLCVVLIAVAAAIAPPNLRLGRSALTVAEAKKSTRSIDRSVDRLSPVTASSTSWFLHARRRQHSHSHLNSRRHLPSRR